MRNLSFSQIKIYDNNFQNSTDIGSLSGVIDGNTDIGGLAGKVLVVVEKETSFIKRSHSMLKKAASIVSFCFVLALAFQCTYVWLKEMQFYVRITRFL